MCYRAFMEAKPFEPNPFQRFDALARQVMSVPKAEIDRRAKEARKEREERKKR
jgi:hypothetical protein